MRARATPGFQTMFKGDLMIQRIQRKHLMRVASVGGVLTLLVASGWALAQVSGILFPDWSPPTKGTYKEPAAKIGKKVSEKQPWSVTTVTSSIEGKTVKGKPVTVVGEIIDLSCYLQVGKHGDKHRECGQ